MLKKITAIRNVGKFKNAGAIGDTTLRNHSMIFGANGIGKTTLCAILRSLSNGDPDHVNGRRALGSDNNPEIEILMDDGRAVFRDGGWNLTLPDITVFDGTFIAENVHSGDVVDIEHKRNLYRVIIGRDGVELALEEVRLAGESRAQTARVTATRNDVQHYVPDGIDLGNFLGLVADPDIDTKIMEKERELAAAKQADDIRSRKFLTPLPVPDLPDRFETMLATTLDDIEKSAEEQVKEHIAHHNMADSGSSWLADGTGFLVDDTCPFCGQRLEGVALIHAYQAIFGEAYGNLKTEIDSLTDEIEETLGDKSVGAINTQMEQNKGAAEFWGKYCDLNVEDVTPPGDFTETLIALRDSATALLTRKAASLLEPVQLDSAMKDAQAAYDQEKTVIAGINKVIDDANTRIKDKKAKTEDANLGVIEADLILLKATKTRHEPAVAQVCGAFTEAEATKNRMEEEKAAIRNRLEEHTKTVIEPYESRINTYLDKFNAGFRITETTHGYPGGVATSSYELVINDTQVGLGDNRTAANEPSFKNTLSSGDRSTLALAFFLAHLDHDPQCADRIVVFDDPFNSQDRFRRTQTVHEIRKKGEECSQALVLSHDASFLKQVWEKCPRDQRIALQLADCGDQGTRVLPFDLDDACKGRAASEMDDLISYASTRAGNANDVIKKIRVVLETHCRSTYPAYFDADDNLGGIIEKIRETGDQHPAWPQLDELDQINDYSRDHHHGENPDKSDAGNQIDQTELAGYVQRTLRVANNLQA